jgi:hypothetical protein
MGGGAAADLLREMAEEIDGQEPMRAALPFPPLAGFKPMRLPGGIP